MEVNLHEVLDGLSDAAKKKARVFLTKLQKGGLKSPKNKGSGFESLVSKMLSEWWGEEKSFRRTPMSGAFDTISKGAAERRLAGDILVPADCAMFIECKKREGWDVDSLLYLPGCEVLKWWEKAKEQCPEGFVPLLVFAKNNRPPLILMPGTWTPLLKERGCIIFSGSEDSIGVCSLEIFLRDIPPSRFKKSELEVVV